MCLFYRCGKVLGRGFVFCLRFYSGYEGELYWYVVLSFFSIFFFMSEDGYMGGVVIEESLYI